MLRPQGKKQGLLLYRESSSSHYHSLMGRVLYVPHTTIRSCQHAAGFLFAGQMIQYTTPTITLTVKGKNLIGYDIYASLEQGDLKLERTGQDLTVSTETVDGVTNTIVEFELTQAESGAYTYGKKANAQINWIDENGKRKATNIKAISVERNILNREI